MIYVVNDKALFTDEGAFIKEIECPLATRLARSISAAASEREFNCAYCKTKVKNLKYLSDQQALELAQDDETTCFFATSEATNVVHVQTPKQRDYMVEGERAGRRYRNPDAQWPTIRTARSRDEINFAIANGFRVLIRKTPDYSMLRGQIGVYRDTETGLIVEAGDLRFPPDSSEYYEKPMEQVFGFFHYTYGEPEGPYAAYVIPSDLAPGTEVFVEDMIENLIFDEPQDTRGRVSGWWATWTGKTLELQPVPESDILG